MGGAESGRKADSVPPPPSWVTTVGGVPAQARWGSQRIPSPCHQLPWAGTPAHSSHLATARKTAGMPGLGALTHPPDTRPAQAQTLSLILSPHTETPSRPLGSLKRRRNCHVFFEARAHTTHPRCRFYLFQTFVDHLPYARRGNRLLDCSQTTRPHGPGLVKQEMKAICH